VKKRARTLSTAAVLINTKTAENLKRYRKEKGLTQTKLGEIAGLVQAGIGKMERNEVVFQLSTLADLASALNITVCQLIE
jgi:transcriptional regulator with XRE-family HTH domain